ncbi:MAG: F0F1 ATP synthase subunit A [Pseudomonadota bacterium]|jgi:F-type H+-transporting ATPase subunit a
MVDPMSQFVVKTVLPLKVGDLDLSITNSTLAMAGAAGLLCLFFGLAFSRAAIVPSRLQTVGELLYELIDDLGESIMGHAGKAFFPLVFSLFAFIMTMNFMGMFLIFTPTSQLAVTATLAMITMGIVVIVGFVKNGLGFFKLFVPSGVPIFLLPLMIPIEVISFLVRPLTLALRLFGNMLGGHVVLNIFGSFVVSLGLLGLAGGLATLGFFGSALALSSVVALLALEFIVAFLQAFVFAALTCVYLNDVVNLHHH